MAIAAIAESMPERARESGRPTGGAMATAPSEAVPPAVSRMVLSAQEDLRREIARAMHDGPAQSLTNIVLQAQIVDRLVARDPEQARGEIRQLVAMVQSTLDATKSFIFDVRPMVLDDLGLVPTLRRAARERGRRAHVPVEFESFGSDRRMAMEVEGGLFRILDETLGGVPVVEPRPGHDPPRLGRAGGGPRHRRAGDAATTPSRGSPLAPVGLAGDPGPAPPAARAIDAPTSWPRDHRSCSSCGTAPPVARAGLTERVGVWSAERDLAVDRGQGLVEYGLILSLTALVATVILVFFGSQLAVALDIIGSAIDSAT